MMSLSKEHSLRVTNLLTLAAIVVATSVLPAAAQGQSKRIGLEVAIGGLTIEERLARSSQLHEELQSILPAGAATDRLHIGITQEDIADLAVIQPSGSAPLRVGVVKPVPGGVVKPTGKPFNHGVLEENPDGSFVWAMEIRSPGARALRIHFTDFSLPDNAEMYLLGANEQAHGPYTFKGRYGNGEFWSRSIRADTATIVLHYIGETPATDRPKISFTISEVAHIRGKPPRSLEKIDDTWPCSDTEPCLVDANCIDTGPAAPAEDAVAKMEWIDGPWVHSCSGGLLADTDTSTQIPYFLTANHCLESDNSNLETFFNYTTETCGGVCPDRTVTAASTVGFVVVATGGTGDFTLGTLSEAPPAGAVFLGWNNAPVAFSHGEDLYRISNPNFGPQAYSQHSVDDGNSLFSPECTAWPRGERIYSIDVVGATMGGSSGSPVLNGAGEVVGQLSGCCGYNCGDECDSASNWTVDGALAFYWDSVSLFLDPVCNSDADCDDGLFCTGAETCADGICLAGSAPCGDDTICNESTNTCDPLPVGCGDGVCGAGEDCFGCPEDCRQKTVGSPRGRYCCDGDLPDCGDVRCNESPWVCEGSICVVNSDCDDGLYCSGTETCVGGSCQSSGDPCASGTICNESTDTCEEPTGDCAEKKSPCLVGVDCCSGNCVNGVCRGN